MSFYINAYDQIGPRSPLDHAYSTHYHTTVQKVQKAIREKRVTLAYQPIVYAQETGQTAFYEGLLRVMDDNGAVIPAGEFMGAVENLETGRILDCVALEMGLMSLYQNPDVRISINMSARSIAYPRWMHLLNEGLAREPSIAQRLILEITEASAMTIPEVVNVFMNDLHRRGISFALDDFGSGFTAFRYFREFEFDIVKIDGQFIRNIHKDPDNQVITAALLDIAKQFDMYTVAEMVETPDELHHLVNIGVDCIQGFHTGRPSINPPWIKESQSDQTG